VTDLDRIGRSGALTTPDVPACQVQTPLPSRNDGKAEVVSADVDIAAKSFTVLAVVPAAAGSNGPFEATSLSPSGTCKVGDGVATLCETVSYADNTDK
jgi:hypothetical protein